MDNLVRYAPQPAIVLSSSALILAANGGACRLMGCDKNAAIPQPLNDISIHDLGIVLVPDKEPFLRELDLILKAAASCAQPEYSDSPSQAFHRENEDTLPDQGETTNFWDDQAKCRPTQEIDVLVSRITLGPKQIHSQKRPPLSIRAHMCVNAFLLDQQIFFMVTFCRPSPHLHLLSQKTGHEAQPLLHPPIGRKEDVELFEKLIPHCGGIIDSDGQVTYLTPSWYDFTGVDDTQSLGSQWATVIHPEDIEEMMVAWVHVVRYGIAHWTYEARYRMRDSSYRWFLIRVQSLEDEEGRVVRWYASMLDVHESALARIETERSRQAILRLLSQADVSLWGISQARDVYMREGALSWSPPRGPHSQNPGPDSGTDGEIDRIIKDILDGKSLVKTLEHQVADSWYRTKFVADPSQNRNKADGRPIVEAVLGLTIDVTDVRARADLQIENEHLIATERAATESTRLKSRFLANVNTMLPTVAFEYRTLTYHRCHTKFEPPSPGSSDCQRYSLKLY